MQHKEESEEIKILIGNIKKRKSMQHEAEYREITILICNIIRSLDSQQITAREARLAINKLISDLVLICEKESAK